MKNLAGAAAAAAVMLWPGAAYASHLEVPPGAPLWAHIGADALLFLHIAGGAVGIVSGFAALAFRKGGAKHRAAGKVFFVAMLIGYTVATCVAPFLNDGQRTNTVAGVMALYLLLSGRRAARNRDFRAGRFEYLGLAVALAVVAAGLLFMRMGARDPSGTVDGSPPPAFIAFAMTGAAAALGELNVIARRTISEVSRIARHLWRMCFSLLIASGSFFLGQQRLMPAWMHGSPVLLALALAPLAAMVFWLVWIRISKRWRSRRDSNPRPTV